jgi:hypothetical protein
MPKKKVVLEMGEEVWITLYGAHTGLEESRDIDM